MRISAVQQFTQLDFPGRMAAIAFVPGCNFRCGYCHNPEFVDPELVARMRDSFIPEESFFSFLESRRGLLDGVVISGGEPTIMSDLPQFIERVRSMGFAVKLDTNGTNPAMISDLLKRGMVEYVAMDYKTSIADYPRFAGGVARWNEAVAESRDMLKRAAIPVEFRTTLIREIHTPEIIGAMRDELAGAQQLFLQEFRPGVTLDPSYAKLHPFSTEETADTADVFRESVQTVIIR